MFPESCLESSNPASSSVGSTPHSHSLGQYSAPGTVFLGVQFSSGENCRSGKKRESCGLHEGSSHRAPVRVQQCCGADNEVNRKSTFTSCKSPKTIVDLRMHDVKFESHNVLADEEIRQGIKEFSNWPTIPQVFFEGEFIGGCDILLQMHQSGELVEELNKIGIKSALLTGDSDGDNK